MPTGRLRGRDTEVLIIRDGEVESSIVDVKDFSLEPKQDVLSEAYLGSGSEMKDEDYKGAGFSLTLHVRSADPLNLVRRLIDRAKRKVPTFQVNIKTTLNYPDGTRHRVILPDCSFGAMPLNIGGKAEYATVTLNGEVDDFDVI